MRNKIIYIVGVLALLLLINGLAAICFVRVDLTAEKRYTLSPQSYQLVNGLDKPLQVILYLNGDLNPAFDRLRTSVVDMFDEISVYAPKGIILKQINPADAPGEQARQENYIRMDKKGLSGISVNERDREGKVSSKVVFPWVELVYNGDTVPVRLLKNDLSLSPQEILNVSIGDLEYGLTEGIRLLTLKDPSRIAFIEGHGELEEPYVSEATELLSHYYQVDRGRLNGNPADLLPYKLLIIAGPEKPFTEAEKFALDQYLMSGGSLFFLVDGVEFNETDFSVKGESATLKRELNLDDLLFTYGVRINPVMVQDLECTGIRLASSVSGASEAYTTLPWYFAPLLSPNPVHPVTRNISAVKSEFVSTLSFAGNGSQKKSTLLATASHTHLLPVPRMVSLRYAGMPSDMHWFNQSGQPVAALVEGYFSSAFLNRLLPPDAVNLPVGRLQESLATKIIVAASSSLIKNNWQGKGRDSRPQPLGYDAVSGEQFGNADFIVNAVNYLAGNQQWLTLRSRNYQLRLLDKQKVQEQYTLLQIGNVVLPLMLVFIAGGTFAILRKRKYGR